MSRRLSIQDYTSRFSESNIYASLAALHNGAKARYQRLSAPASLADQKTFFGRHVGPWAGHFFADLEAARSSVLYASVGAVGRVFMEIEAEGFRMSGA